MHVTWFPDTEVNATFQSSPTADTQDSHASLRSGCTPSFRWPILTGKCAVCGVEDHLALVLHKEFFSCKSTESGWELTLNSTFFDSMLGFLRSLARSPNIEECICTTENPIKLGCDDLEEVPAKLTGPRTSCLVGPGKRREWICIRLRLTVRSVLRFRPPVLDTLAVELTAVSQSVLYPAVFAPRTAYYTLREF